jgi:hypothetical protein
LTTSRGRQILAATSSRPTRAGGLGQYTRRCEETHVFRVWERWGAALGILTPVLWVVAFIIGNGSPEPSDSDAKIVAWYESSSHQTHQIIAFFLFLAGVVCFIGFLAALRERIAEAEAPTTAMAQLAFGAGIASAALWVVAVMFFAAPGFVADDTGAKDVVPATFRTLTDLGYLAWVAATVIGAVTVWATSAVAIRTAFLPRWFGWVGVLVGVIQLLGLRILPMAPGRRRAPVHAASGQQRAPLGALPLSPRSSLDS